MSMTAISEGYAVGSSQVLETRVKTSSVPEATPIVFVLDEDAAVCELLGLLVRAEGWRCETYASAEEFLRRPLPSAPNCLVLDVSLPEFNGLALQSRVAAERPEMPIIFVAVRVDVPTTVRAMKGGAVEFFVKPLQEDTLLKSIGEALERSRVAIAHEAQKRVVQNCYSSLSRREREVMALVVSGLLNKQVAGELGISEITVKAHRGQVMQKMNANSLPDLVKMAATLGLA